MTYLMWNRYGTELFHANQAPIYYFLPRYLSHSKKVHAVGFFQPSPDYLSHEKYLYLAHTEPTSNHPSPFTSRLHSSER